MPAPASDQEFVSLLREAVGRYFAAVDGWESSYRKYYRLPGGAKLSDDLLAERREFEDRRRELAELLPRARSLFQMRSAGCFRGSSARVFRAVRASGANRFRHQPG